MSNREPTAREVAYSAGLFEGEGTVVYVKTRNYIYVRIKMTDQDVIERMATIWPGSRLGSPVKPQKPHHKPQYEWFLGGRDQVLQFYSLIKPDLGQRRIAQFEERITLSQPRRHGPQRSCVTDGRATQRGYHAHLRLGEEPCEACRVAYNLYMEQYRRGKGVPERPPAMSKAELNARKDANRRLQYANDPEYRQRILDRNAAYRERRRHASSQ